MPTSTMFSRFPEGIDKLIVSERGAISVTFLPTIELISSKLISRFPSASTLSEVAPLKAAFASASSILEAEPKLNLSSICWYLFSKAFSVACAVLRDDRAERTLK